VLPELVLAGQVKSWVEKVAPGERQLCEAAMARALASYAGGASVSEACEEARRLVACRMRHPSFSPSTAASKSFAVAS
jgi:hypothetical protein